MRASVPMGDTAWHVLKSLHLSLSHYPTYWLAEEVLGLLMDANALVMALSSKRLPTSYILPLSTNSAHCTLPNLLIKL